jgi:4'-phosphopantetheinyl transferase
MSASTPVQVLDRPLEADVHVNALAGAIGTPAPYAALPLDTIDVWIARIDFSEDVLKKWVYVLDDEERARQDRYQLPSLSRRFAARRVFLRRVLARYLEIAPEQIRLRYEEQGKPFLDHPTNLQFSLSHTQSTAAIAVARERKVGIDLETLCNDMDFELIAKAYFSTAEAETIYSGGPHLADIFFRYWTAKESYLKAIGTGLTLPLDSFEVSDEPPDGTDRLTIKTDTATRWTCCAWKPCPALHCAVTSERTDWNIRMQQTQSLDLAAQEGDPSKI